MMTNDKTTLRAALIAGVSLLATAGAANAQTSQDAEARIDRWLEHRA